MNYSTLSDDELERLYSHGDPPAGAELWQRHVRWLLTQAHRLAPRDPHLAEQALAEVEELSQQAEHQRKFQSGPESKWRLWIWAALRQRIRRLVFQALPEWYGLTSRSFPRLHKAGVPETLSERLKPLAGKRFWTAEALLTQVARLCEGDELREWRQAVVDVARHTRHTEAGGDDDTANLFFGSRDESPQEAAARKEFLSRFRRHLPGCARRLAPRLRRLLYYRLRRGTAWKQLAADLFDSSDHNVAWRNHQTALQQLGECLASQGVRYER